MALFLSLLLAHTLSDFVLQTRRIYELKIKSIWGVFLHVGIFLSLALIFAWPVWFHSFGFFFWLMLVSLSHILMDKIKLIFNKTIVQKEMTLFLVDQGLHILALASLGWFVGGWMDHSPLIIKLSGALTRGSGLSALSFVLMGSLLIYITYAVEVILFYYDRTVSNDIVVLQYPPLSLAYRGLALIFGLWLHWSIGALLILIVYFISRRRLIYDRRRFIIETEFMVFIYMIGFLAERWVIV